jgi:membrane-associated phospholipid phosphatase
MKFQKILSIIVICIIPHTYPYAQMKEDNFAKIIGIALPSAMITYGLISLGDNDIRGIDFHARHSLEINNRFWNTHVDDYMQFSPAVAAYTLKLCKVESRHNLLEMTILYGVSSILAGGIVSKTKVITGRERPDHSNNLSFPSGHTQTAFVAAEFLHQEYKNQSVWISIGGYSAAAFVGIARIYNNKHWVSDVVAGAGIGILSTKVVYWTYPYFREKIGKNDKPLQTVIFPGYNNGYVSLNLSHIFR